jgi:DNA-directed RNA polymerase specialized sigma24 family protein
MNHQHGHPSLQDELFIRGIISGGAAAEQAMQDLYLLYRKRVLAYIVSLIRLHPGFKGQPEDLMHDAFIVLVHRVEISDGHIRSLFSFWLGITKHLLLNHMRKDERVILVQEPAEEYFTPEDSNEDKFLESEAAEQLQFTFDQLGNRCRRSCCCGLSAIPCMRSPEN